MRYKKRGIVLLVFLSLLMGAVSIAFGQKVRIPRISIEQLKTLIDNGADMAIIAVQPKKLYDRGHIKGAICFPWARKIDPAAAENLPRDKTLILYCDCGPGEADSNDVALQLKRMGFMQVKVLAHPSIRGWREKGYPTEK